MSDIVFELEASLAIDREMAENGWHLTLFRNGNEWKAVYMHPQYIMQSAKGGTIPEVIRAAREKAVKGMNSGVSGE